MASLADPLSLVEHPQPSRTFSLDKPSFFTRLRLKRLHDFNLLQLDVSGALRRACVVEIPNRSSREEAPGKRRPC
jgi:hypothetical protein